MKKFLKEAGVTEELVLEAIHERATNPTVRGRGLCKAFDHATAELREDTGLGSWYGRMDKLLIGLNNGREFDFGDSGTYDCSPQSQRRRDVLLAFMLTWLNDED